MSHQQQRTTASNQKQQQQQKQQQHLSSYDVFSTVDKLVAKPIMGSDGAAAWQNFRNVTSTTGSSSTDATSHNNNNQAKALALGLHRPSVAPVAPLKKVDRLAFASWKEEQDQERQVRQQSGDAELNAGYTTFREKGDRQAEEATQRKEKKRIEARTRPDDKPFFLAAETFQGWKFDYVFTTKDRGTGYYWDGMDSLKKLRGELKDDHDHGDGDHVSSRMPQMTATKTAQVLDSETRIDGDAKPSKTTRSKKKRKKDGPIIVDDPNNPLEQVAAAIQRSRHATSSSSSSSSLPEGWEAAIDSATQKTYYFCRATGQRQWDMPAATATSSSLLPAGWNVVKDPSSGKEYYYNAETRETRWDRPQ